MSEIEIGNPKITMRRRLQLEREGVDINELKEKAQSIIKDLAEEEYTLKQGKCLVQMMDCMLEEMTKRSPSTKLSDIIR